MFKVSTNILGHFPRRIDISKLISLNKLIHLESSRFDYHMDHILLTSKYSKIIANRLSLDIDKDKLIYASLAHDLLKDNKFNSKLDSVEKEGLIIPQNLNRYVRENLDILEKYDLDDYFNTDIQLHALSSGIYLIRELDIVDPQILYPIFFHSCPIIPIYKELDREMQLYIDIIMLADKLSSNYLRINKYSKKVVIDLDLVVFGENRTEFNFTLGLFLARLLSQGNSTEKYSLIATEYYYDRLLNINPLLPKDYIQYKKLGDAKLWPKRF